MGTVMIDTYPVELLHKISRHIDPDLLLMAEWLVPAFILIFILMKLAEWVDDWLNGLIARLRGNKTSGSQGPGFRRR
jgi:hypothetical protein